MQIPPARPLALEAPKTVASGQSRARFQLASHGALFGERLTSGNVRLRRGVADRLELALDGAVVNSGNSLYGNNMYVGRVGGKLNPLETPNIALTGGVGGGFSPSGGGMVSADGGVTLGAHNRYLVPYASLRTFMSTPVGAEEVRTGGDIGDVDTPTLTGGTGVTLGLAIIRDKYTISAGLDQTVLRDADGSEVYFSAGVGFELALE